LSDQTDGNPVFTFRAGFRTTAGILQRWAILLGFACLLVGGTTWLIAADASRAQCAGRWQFLAGLGLIAAGLLWGFWWRGYLRTEFRREFGEH
jgi:hypothetical protein